MPPSRITDVASQVQYIGSYKFPQTLSLIGGGTYAMFNRRRGFTIDQETGNILISGSHGAAYNCVVVEFSQPALRVPTEAQRLARDRNSVNTATLVTNPVELWSGNPNIDTTLSPELFTEGFAVAKRSDLGLTGSGKIFVHSGRYNYNVGGAGGQSSDRPSICLYDFPFTNPVGGGGPFGLQGHHVNGLGITTYCHFTDSRLGGHRIFTGAWFAQGSTNSSPHPATCIGWTPPDSLPANGALIGNTTTLCKDVFPITHESLPGQLVSYIPGQGLVSPMPNDCRFMGAAFYDVPPDALNPQGTRGYVRIARAGSAQLYCSPGLNGTGQTHDCLIPSLANGTTPPGGYCSTPTGYHNEPYTPVFLFYDLDEFDLVRRGLAPQNSPRHHDYLLPDLPLGNQPISWWPGTCHQDSLGAAFHYATSRLHVCQQAAYADGGSTYPVVHVYQFSNAAGGVGPPPPVEQRLRRFRIS